MSGAERLQPRRALGRTGFVAAALGIGDLADRNLSLDACVATPRRALEAGLNLIDTACPKHRRWPDIGTGLPAALADQR
jgi:hypothetical protein